LVNDRITELRDKAALFRNKAARAKNEKQRVLLELANVCERTIARTLKANAASENQSAGHDNPLSARCAATG
jgi:hypothetical protein